MHDLLSLDQHETLVPPSAYERKPYGPWRAVVTNNEDPQKVGRLQVRIPEITGNSPHPTWAWPSSAPFGGGKTDGVEWGSLFVPPKNAWVHVEFYNGDPEHPVWLPGWFASGEMPAVLKTHYPNRRGIVSVKGHYLIFDDDPGGDADAQLVQLKAASGPTMTFNRDGEVIIEAQTAIIKITKNGDVTVDAKTNRDIIFNGGTLKVARETDALNVGQLSGMSACGPVALTHIPGGYPLPGSPQAGPLVTLSGIIAKDSVPAPNCAPHTKG